MRCCNRLLSKTAFGKNSSKNEINTQLARITDKTDIQLAAKQFISNNELGFDEKNIMQPLILIQMWWQAIANKASLFIYFWLSAIDKKLKME